MGTWLSQQVFKGMFSPMGKCTLDSCILLFGKQPVPFPLLAIIKPHNQVSVLHGIKRLGVAFGTQHPNNNKKNQIRLKVLSLSGVLDAQKTHTMSDKITIMVAGSCGLGICDKWVGGW